MPTSRDAADRVRLADNAGLGSDPSDNGAHYTRRPDALPSHPATLGDGDRGVRRDGSRLPDDGRRDARARRRTTTRNFAAVVAATGFFQLLLDLTIEEALVKYGFRYSRRSSWGRLRRLFEVALAFKLVGGVLARARDRRAGAVRAGRLGRRAGCVRADADRLADLPVAQAPESGRRRRDHPPRPLRRARRVPRRLDGAAPRRARRSACRYGVDGAVIGMVVAQVVATAAISRRRHRRVPALPAGAAPSRSASDARACGSFVVSSTLASSLDSARGDARHGAAAGGRADRPGRLLPQRPGAGDRVRGALGARRGS